MLFARGLGPNGSMRIRYGGLPSLPVMETVRLEHCCGIDWKDHEYALEDGSSDER